MLVTTGSGGQQFGQRYYGFGNVGYAVGLGSVTDYKYTGQRRESAVLGINLYDYGARFYSAFTGRFLSADTLVPGAGNPQALNRYSYALNNPLKFIDPTGHSVCNDPDSCDNSGGGLVLNEGGDAEEQQCHKICGAAAPEGPEGGADITQEEIAALGQKNAEFFKNTQESIAEVQSQANAASTSVAAET
ncbi:MAG: RHS repeat-associated core domain-containing protein, partial [Chloroflexi bacterium]|nr:RHS repeat-associated core domain-containing protein [Chloroflexota bacterium]